MGSAAALPHWSALAPLGWFWALLALADMVDSRVRTMSEVRHDADG